MKNTKVAIINKTGETQMYDESENLIARAIDKNVSVEFLERLLASNQKLRAERAREQFMKEMAEFQGECPIIEKKKKVDFTPISGNRVKYNYAPLEVIVDSVKELLSKHGFSYMFDTETNGKMKVVCRVTHKGGHTEISKFDMEIDNTAKMNISQKYGAALTYAKRYAFCSAFGISVKDEDNETVLGGFQNTSNSSSNGAREENYQKMTNDTTSNKCAVCGASGRYHRPDCVNKPQVDQQSENIDREHFCAIHNKPMKRREAKNGGHYWDHRWEDVFGSGEWNKCNGSPKKDIPNQKTEAEEELF